MITYLVSADPDIRPSDRVLRRSGKQVRYDTQIDAKARRALRKDRSYIVVAHGNHAGTVKLFRSDWNEARPWLYVGMDDPPRGTRVYLYACYAGRKLPEFLRDCFVLGHIDWVPIPIGDARHVVMAFLREVERLIEMSADRDECRTRLQAYVDAQLVKAVNDRKGMLRGPLLVALQRSLSRRGQK